MKPLNDSLSNNKLLLREFISDDWKSVHKYASQEIVCRYQPWGPNTKEDSKDFVDQVLEDGMQNPRKRYVWAIDYQGSMIGAGELNIRDVTHRIGEIAYIVHPDYWGKGIATDVARLIIIFGFQELRLHRIVATCDPRNIGSAKVLEKLGMKREGILRENVLIRDGWRDSLLYSILEQEWVFPD